MPIHCDITNHIAIITIDNPPLNAFTADFVEQLAEIVDGFASNTDVRVAIITGAGSRSFTAGADIKAWSAPGAPPRRARNPRDVRNYLEALLDSAVPLVAAVNGYCLGHGIVILSGCDIVLASETAKFGLPEINVGVGNGYRMMRELFPRSHARHVFYTGEYVDAAEAYRIGAVYRLSAPEQLMEDAMKLAGTIAEKSPRAIRMFKEVARWGEEMDLQKGYRFEGQALKALVRDPAAAAELLEARAAFMGKRKPRFD